MLHYVPLNLVVCTVGLITEDSFLHASGNRVNDSSETEPKQ